MKTTLRVLKMPWIATIRSGYGYLYVCIPFVLAVNISKALPIHGALRELGVALLLTAEVVVWKLVSNTLSLARDAHDLRLPGIQRDADRTLSAFATVSVVLPALVLGAVFGHIAVWLVSLALVAACVLTLCVMPRLLTLVLAVAGGIVLWSGHRPPLPGGAAYLAWALPVLIVLMVASLQRWRTLQHAITWDTGPWRSRTVAGGYRRTQLHRLYGRPLVRPHGPRQVPHTRDRYTLARVGPEYPMRSIQAALHQTLVPFDLYGDTPRVARIHALMVIATLALPGAALAGKLAFDWVPSPHLVAPHVLMVAILMTLPGAAGRATALCWTGPHQNLALLGLLPGLGPRRRLARAVLTACASHEAAFKLAAAISLALVAMAWRLPGTFYVYLVLACVCGLTMTFATVACMLAGWRPGRWFRYAFYFSAVLVPGFVTQRAYAHMVSAGAFQTRVITWPLAGAFALWLLWSVGFALLAWHGWRVLQRRPHPFLSDE